MAHRVRGLVVAVFGLGLLLAPPSAPASAGPGPDGCGNNTIEDPPEKCDDGNTVSGDGCSGISCLPEVCGDHITNPDPAPGPAEECDDGNTAPNDGCDASCHLECGNGTIEGAETCDESGESATCDDDCTAVACGDGNVNHTAGETCEPPGTARCDATCQAIDVPQTRQQQACINRINGNGLAVMKAQDRDTSSCFGSVASGKTGDVATCLGADLGRKVTKAVTATFSTDAEKCGASNTPDFGYGGAVSVTGGARSASLDSTAAIFGADPVIVDKETNKAGAACQSEVSRRQFKLAETWAAEANKAKRTALKGKKSTPPVVNAAELATAIDSAVAGSAKITKAENGVNSGVAKKCPDAIVDALFDCDGATTGNGLTLCVILQAKRAGCLALEAADDLALSCPGD